MPPRKFHTLWNSTIAPTTIAPMPIHLLMFESSRGGKGKIGSPSGAIGMINQATR